VSEGADRPVILMTVVTHSLHVLECHPVPLNMQKDLVSIKNSDTYWNFTSTWLEGKWIQLEDVMLREVSQAQKDKGPIFSLICGR
jgi:hypothetical protein